MDIQLIQPGCERDKVVTAAAERADTREIGIIFKNRHHTCQTSLDGCLEIHARLTDTALRNRTAHVIDHKGHRALIFHSFRNILTGDIALDHSLWNRLRGYRRRSRRRSRGRRGSRCRGRCRRIFFYYLFQNTRFIRFVLNSCYIVRLLSPVFPEMTFYCTSAKE